MTPRFEKRLIAYFIDFIIPIILAFFSYVFFWDELIIFSYLSFFIWFELLSFFYFSLINVFLSFITNGRTFGNLIARIKMVNLNAGRITLRQCLLKYLPLSLVPLTIINAFYMLIVHTETTIFDNLSKTSMINDI